MLPASRNISVYAGDDYEMLVRLRVKTVDGTAGDPVDLTGVTPSAQIRVNKTDSSALTSFTCTIPDPLTGIIHMKLTHTQTTTLVNGVYDLQVTFSDGTVKTFLSGAIQVTAEVTRV